MIEDLRLPLLPMAARLSERAEVDVAALVAAHGAVLFRVAHAVLRNRAEAEDAVQDAFVRVLEHRGSLPAVREMRAWLVRITWNLAVDRRRRVRPEQAESWFFEGLVTPAPGVEKTLGDAQEARRVLEAVDRLPKGERQVLLLSALDELSTRDISEAMGKSESAVRALLFRARSRLLERLGREERA